MALLVVLLLPACKKAAKPLAERSEPFATRQMAMRAGLTQTVTPGAVVGGLAEGAAGGAGGAAGKVADRIGPKEPADPASYLAYAYGMTLQLPGDRVIEVMERHAAACRSVGPRVCQLVGTRRDGDPRETLHGALSLRAEPKWLQAFMKGAQGDARDAAGRVTSQWTTTDDLTREIVDTEATLRAKRALRDRLQQLLSTRPGSLADLLGVERELARVQGEVDSTESSLAVMHTRVTMSALTLGYESQPRAVAGNTFQPLRLALVEFVAAVVESTARLVTFVGSLLPWVIAGALAAWVLWQIRRRRARRTASPEPAMT